VRIYFENGVFSGRFEQGGFGVGEFLDSTPNAARDWLVLRVLVDDFCPRGCGSRILAGNAPTSRFAGTCIRFWCPKCLQGAAYVVNLNGVSGYISNFSPIPKITPDSMPHLQEQIEKIKLAFPKRKLQRRPKL
jgi:hypothetical protein